MEIKHPSYYKKLRDKPQATSDMLNADNSERFVKGARSQASKGTSSNKR